MVRTVKNIKEKISIPVTKEWKDSGNKDGKRPENVTVQLYANGEIVDGVTATLSEGNSWKSKFENLAKFDDNGDEIEYTIKEIEVEGYTSVVSGDAQTGYTITNSYTPETTSIAGTKTWSDSNNQDGKRPTSITVNLLANGEKVDSKVVTADENWSYEFTNLPQYKNGQLIAYTVSEEAVDGYSTSVNGYNITNSYTPQTVDVKASKNWDDNDNQDGKRPVSITINLLADGEKVDSQEVTASEDGTWIASFTNLPQFENGQEIAYSVQEIDTPEGYTSSVEGQTITNTHDSETVVISGRKEWNDNDNQDGRRTTSVRVQILNGEQVVDEIEVSESTNWAFESKALPKYENGKEINYTVKEVAVSSYEAQITKDAEGQYTITNTHTPEKINLSGQKIWNDNNNQDGIRPSNVTVELLANGESTGQTVVASESTAWQYTFENLDRYKDGKEIEYTIKEVEVPKGYTAEVEGMNVTNSHKPETINVSGKKTWVDNNNQDGIRPNSITLHLLANGVDTGLTVTANAETNWSYSFEGVAKYKDGEEIVYTVSEDSVEGYTAEVSGMNVTNTHTPSTSKIDKPSSPSHSKDDESKRKSTLPSTGETNTLLLTIVGVVLIMVIILRLTYLRMR